MVARAEGENTSIAGLPVVGSGGVVPWAAAVLGRVWFPGVMNGVMFSGLMVIGVSVVQVVASAGGRAVSAQVTAVLAPCSMGSLMLRLLMVVVPVLVAVKV